MADDVSSNVGSIIDEIVIAVSDALGDNCGRVGRVPVVGEETVVGLALSRYTGTRPISACTWGSPCKLRESTSVYSPYSQINLTVNAV